MSYTDALAQIGQIQAQIAALSTAFTPAAPAPGGGAAAAPAAPTSFADQLAQAQAPASTDMLSASGTVAPGDVFSPAQPVATVPVVSPSATSGRLTSGQQQFASALAAQTGLDPGVISAWLLAEENGGAAQGRQAAGNNDWLNIGYTDSGTYGAGDSVWGNPITAASATAGWLRGQNTIPGYGTASAGIQAILASAGQPPAAQISAIQQSGWASGGYPELATLYSQVA